MELQTIDINYATAQDGNNFDAIKATAERLFNATQEEFETIKNEAWYMRVFDMVTLSNKKEIRLATQIGNIAQAQDIVLELLLRLSTTSADISGLLTAALEKIKTHTDLSIRLAERIKRAESILCYGSAKSISVGDLQDAGKIVIVGLIHRCHDLLEDPNPYQQQYVSSLLKNLNNPDCPSDLTNALRLLDSIPERKLIMEIVLEYCALADDDSDIDACVETVLDDLELGRKVGLQLQEKINRSIKLMGKEGLSAKYTQHRDTYELEESFFIELENLVDDAMLANEEPDYTPYGEREHYKLSQFETVPEGTHKVYANKIINFESILILEGKLTFKKCTIFYNLPQQLSKINCSKNASIEFFDCEIRCIEKRNDFFIDDAGSAEDVALSIIQSELIDGYNFFRGSGENSIEISDSLITTPIKNVIECRRGKLYFKNTKIDLANLEDRQKIADHGDSLFYAKNIEVNNSLISCDWPKDHEISSHYYGTSMYYGNIFKADYLKLVQSSLVGIKDLMCCDENAEIDRCDFYKCFHLTRYNRIMNISNSNFIKNRYLYLSLGKGCKLTFCQFIESEGKTIESDYDGGVLIENCEFYNSNAVDGSNVLEFNRWDEDSSPSTIKNCVFKGIKVSSKKSHWSYYLIKANASEERNKWVLNIENCVFGNIAGTDLFQDKQTFTSWIFSDTEATTIDYKNCIGLNPLVAGDGIESNIPYRTCASNGELIGSSLAPNRDKLVVVENKLGVTQEKVEALGLA